MTAQTTAPAQPAITPAEALFALYRSAAENEGSMVYNIPAAARETPRGTSYIITARDPRCPSERIIFARDAEGLPFIVDVMD